MARRNDGKFYQRKNTWKVIRTLLQVLVCLAVLLVLVRLLFFASYYDPVDQQSYADSSSYELTASGQGAAADSGFICISYNGLVIGDELESMIVSQRAFNEQMAALHASGYVTISQQDVLDYYLRGRPLPEKAMLLIFEDGIYNTTVVAQSTLERYNYMATACTYADSLADSHNRYMTGRNMRKLLDSTYWELGSNGYRLAYINMYDRYGNYFGHLNTNEYVLIHEYLVRDYNHYLMDFLRDEDRLREESVEEMKARIEYDYQQMSELYKAELGFVPELYVLMHANTGMFANDPMVSNENRDRMTQTFAMNFNRQGSCYNDLSASVYDLTRLQSRQYFSTNHLLMRIWDDTRHDVAFVVGDEKEAAKWYIDEGVAEFAGNKIILTSEPYAEGAMTLKEMLVDDLDMTVTLQGNKVGVQSVYLRTDRERNTGVQVSLENYELVVRDLTAGGAELFRQSLFELDGGATQSEEENELEGLIALQEAIIDWDLDPARIEEARQELAYLKRLKVPSIEEGGKPYVPELDISERDERELRIQLVGSRLYVWLDGKQVCERLQVTETGRGSIALGAEVWKASEHYSQTNLHDDVYDAVFIDPVVSRPDNNRRIYYSYRYMGLEAIVHAVEEIFKDAVAFFATNF